MAAVSGKGRKSRVKALFLEADRMRERGEFRSAFKLLLAAAKAGDRGSQLNVGYCYDAGSGTRRNRAAALYWYKRAYRKGEASAAHNIGMIWRDEGKWRQALPWFHRAISLGDDDSALEIAKYYLTIKGDRERTIRYLTKVCRSDRATEASIEEAKRLLKKAGSQIPN